MALEQEIIDRINARLTIEANKLEGGFSQDIIGSVAYELANITEVDLPQTLQNAFVKTAQGEKLFEVGADYGFYQKKATSAIVYLDIEGDVGAQINTNVKATYNNLVFQVTEYKVIPANGIVTVKAQCTTKGVIGNVDANTITEFVTQYAGLKSVNNPEPAYDGVDDETIEDFRQRLLTYLAEDPTNSNEAQYKQWALSIAGVTKAVVYPAEKAGAGNVEVYIASEDVVSNDLITKVTNYIKSVQIINANLTVLSMNYVPMNVSAQLKLKQGHTEESVLEEFKALFKEYLNTVDTVVSYFKISDLLLQCSGVSDVTSYTLNGGTISINLDDIDNAVIGEIKINE